MSLDASAQNQIMGGGCAVAMGGGRTVTSTTTVTGEVSTFRSVSTVGINGVDNDIGTASGTRRFQRREDQIRHRFDAARRTRREEHMRSKDKRADVIRAKRNIGGGIFGTTSSILPTL